VTAPGLAGERTGLAWRRTALSVAAVALLDARLALDVGGPVGTILAAVLIGGWAPFVALVYHSNRRVLGGQPGRPGRSPVLCSLTTIAYAGVGLALVVTTGR
jgi:uncharacterized membrane protein YidH (DUF202 family)